MYMVDRNALQIQLEEERQARQHAVGQARRLQRDVDQLRHDAQRRESELATALLALSVYDQEQDVQDLVEHNIALREQVQSLKAMLEQSMHDYTPMDVNRTLPGDPVKHDGTARLLEDRLTAAPPDFVDQLVTRNEVQQLLANLAAKESQVQLLHQKCASWEQQVIELKFEIQSVRHAAKEQEEVARIAQHSIVRQECCPTCKSQRATNLIEALKMEKKALAATISPRAPRTDLEHYKSLAHLRGAFWLQAMEQNEELSSKLAHERRQNVELRQKMETMESNHRARAEELETLRSRLETTVSCCELLDEQLASASREAERANAEVKSLCLELCSERCQRKTDKTRSARIILDLRGELNKQLMDLEQLHNASIAFSPKNSRGIDPNRRSIAPLNPAA